MRIGNYFSDVSDKIAPYNWCGLAIKTAGRPMLLSLSTWPCCPVATALVELRPWHTTTRLSVIGTVWRARWPEPVPVCALCESAVVKAVISFKPSVFFLKPIARVESAMTISVRRPFLARLSVRRRINLVGVSGPRQTYCTWRRYLILSWDRFLPGEAKACRLNNDMQFMSLSRHLVA